MPVAGLDWIPAPWLAIPVAAIRGTIPGLLDVATEVEAVEDIFITPAFRQPSEGGSGRAVHPESQFPVVEIEPFFGGGIGGG